MDLGVQVFDLCKRMSYDVAIIGGGLAGLALANDLAMRGRNVVVFEKGHYPKHKVCGEFISMESHSYLMKICPELSGMNLPVINNFLLTTPGGMEFKTKLDLGGFGISRFVLEEMLYKKAVAAGVNVVINSKVSAVNQVEKGQSEIISSAGTYNSRLVCNATGRKSNFEVKEDDRHANRVNYVGVKYHVRIARDSTQIEIHNFEGGYCGISTIEDGKSCLCYIVNSEKLTSAGNSIPEMERKFLFRNDKLKYIFENAEFLIKTPVTISGINFNIKRSVNDGMFYLGDSAGSISPITGNGMSMALRSANFLATEFDKYFDNRISLSELNLFYKSFWRTV
jgi:menaquinone-9 beta-reductase